MKVGVSEKKSGELMKRIENLKENLTRSGEITNTLPKDLIPSLVNYKPIYKIVKPDLLNNEKQLVSLSKIT